jgi:outer membrane protein TolC
MSASFCTAIALAVLLLGSSAAAQPASEPTTWTLEAAIARAIEKDEDVVAAEARREGASARVDVARAALFGELTIVGNLTRRAREVTRDVGGETITIQSAYAGGVEAVAIVPIFDRRAHKALRQVRLEREAAGLDEQETRRLIGLEVAATYLAALGAERVVAAAERRAEYATARLADARARSTAGLESSSDATGAELELATAQRERAAAEADLQVAYEELGFLVGGEVTGPLAVPETLLDAAAKSGPLEDKRRLDLAAADLRVDAAHAAAEVPRAGWWPRLDLTGVIGADNEPGFTGEYHDWSVALVATWQVWDGGARNAEARELEASAKAAAAEAAGLRRRARTGVQVARTKLGGARAALVEAERAATAAGKYADEIAILYAQGLTRALEVTDAGQRRFEADVALVRARFDVGIAYLEELATTGGSVEGGAR